MNDDKIDVSLQPIIDDLGIADLPKDAQEEIIAKLGEAGLKNTMMAVLEKLPEEQMPEFEKLGEGGDANALRYFLKKHIPDFDEISRQEMKKVVDDYKRIKAGLS